jgi:protein TonB
LSVRRHYTPAGRAHGPAETGRAPRDCCLTAVQQPAVPAPGDTGQLYPRELEAQGVEGGVLAQFVIDTTGRVRPGSFRVLRLTRAEFAAAVAAALPRMRFLPAERDGRKVP